MEREHVDPGQQVVEVGDPTGEAGVAARVVEHLHTEPGGPAGHRLADATEADDPERRAVDVDAEEVADVEAGPAALAEVGLGIRRPPRRGQHEEERQVGGGLVEHAGCVADRDAEIGGGGHVDVVVAHGHVRHDPQARGAGAQGLRVDAVGEDADHRVDAGDRGRQLGGRVRIVAGPLQHLVTGREQRIEPAVGQATGDEDTGQGERA